MSGPAKLAALSAGDRERLAKLLGMPGSDHAGERDAAGLAAHRLVQQRGLSWLDILLPAHQDEPPRLGWRATCAELLQHRDSLRPWEQKFVSDLPAFPRVSSKQRQILAEIAERVLGRAAA